jgi:hypothetical protein
MACGKNKKIIVVIVGNDAIINRPNMLGDVVVTSSIDIPPLLPKDLTNLKIGKNWGNKVPPWKTKRSRYHK